MVRALLQFLEANMIPKTKCCLMRIMIMLKINLTKEAEHWLQSMDASIKQRHWPTAETIRKISTLKCEVVAVGDHDSAFLDPCLKWRISYTLWVRELVWSFQDVQLYCYVFLKIFLKRKLKYKSEDITSFHVKMLYFGNQFILLVKCWKGKQIFSHF